MRSRTQVAGASGSPACVAYIRVSQQSQAEGHSPSLQRDALIALARQSGYTLRPEHIFEDHERGSRVSRAGYQNLLSTIRAGEAHAVLVYMFDRWGRDAPEWLARARELDRLGVSIISVQEGKDEPGIIRSIRAGMAEQYSRDLAKRIRPALERAARAGTHIGSTPFGYRRIYPEHENYQQRRGGRIVIDEATAWIVRDLYARYAAGTESARTLVRWLNTDPRCPPAPRGGQWNQSTIVGMLRNPAYAGDVRHNRRQMGLYERATPGTEFIVAGLHPALIDRDTWDEVQQRLDAAGRASHFNRPTTRGGHPVALLVGILRCATCGGPVTATHAAAPGRRRQYLCADNHAGRSHCRGRQFPMEVVDAGVLAEVRRVRGQPWTAHSVRRLLQGGDDDKGGSPARELLRALERERERLRRHIRRMSEEDGDISPEEAAAGREVRAEIASRIRALEAHQGNAAQRTENVSRLQRLHRRVSSADLASMIGALHGGDMPREARALLHLVISRAVVSTHLPERAPVWVRVAVEWTSDMQMLLDADLLRLEPESPPPTILTRREKDLARRRRYRACLKGIRADRDTATPL